MPRHYTSATNIDTNAALHAEQGGRPLHSTLHHNFARAVLASWTYVQEYVTRKRLFRAEKGIGRAEVIQRVDGKPLQLSQSWFESQAEWEEADYESEKIAVFGYPDEETFKTENRSDPVIKHAID
jgi:hypothetical protein